MKLEAISQVANSNEVICLCRKNGQRMTHKIILSYLLCLTFASPRRENSKSCYSILENVFDIIEYKTMIPKKNIIQTQTQFIKRLMLS